MRPRSEIQSVILYTLKDEEGNWIPQRFDVNSWVSLQPGKNGGHAKDAIKHGGASVLGAYKAMILKFQLEGGSKTASMIQVQHAYMQRQIQLPPNSPALNAACNCKILHLLFGLFSRYGLFQSVWSNCNKRSFCLYTDLYPSTHRDWINPRSVLQPICVTHADVGEASKGTRNHKELLENSVFFYNAWYHPDRDGGYGRVVPIPLPDFNDPAWPLPDMATSESFRAKMREDFISSMKPTTGSRATHISWFMPISVMVDLFACAPNIHRTRTLFVFKQINQGLFDSLMDRGWDEKSVQAVDTVKCVVDPRSMVFKYHIGRSMLYASFQFNRSRLKDGKVWEQLDQSEAIEIVKLNCMMGDLQQQIEVGYNWTFSALRSEIQMVLGSDAPDDFNMWIVHDGHPSEKVITIAQLFLFFSKSVCT
jgi:hypothetical protein